ncbi:tryptophan halogenase family protein [Alteromonas sp. D210916BOD_24]|uniref:tryptophan halogenase family protein n=1 Tax=Alteromonas sp. D210916BOD_24 TaxID=3157618 RepID=UPI00399D2482
MQKIVIVGGGTAGWMSACYLARAIELAGHTSTMPAPQITLLESSTVPTVGVGEGSTPYLRYFFDYLGVDEQQWMPASSATYKMGINFEHWTHTRDPSGKLLCSDQDAYFHPFFSALDIPTADVYFETVNQYRQGNYGDVNPAHYFTAALMVNKGILPNAISPSANIDYAYHFDAGQLGEFLKHYAIRKDVKHHIGTIEQVHTQGHDIVNLRLSDGQTLDGDLFIDCSGFRGLLGKQALNRRFNSYADTLFNDAAVAIASPVLKSPHKALQTRSIAKQCGWQWEIPLTHRTGNGYVYSSQFCSPSQAERELRESLPPDAQCGEARHLRMDVGRLTHHWQGNCLCIGLSQGFIEPLEATALMLVQYALQQFVDCWQFGQTHQQEYYNAEMNRMFDGIRDYIAAHYYLNTRDDTPYWQACRKDIVVPDTLAYLLDAWDKGANFEAALNEVDNKLVYLRPSWYCIFAGMRRFSHHSLSQVPNNKAALHTLWQSLEGAIVK